MSETEAIIPATSSGGPSVAAVSMSPTPPFKVKRLQPDHNKGTEPKTIIGPEVRMCTISTAGQRQLQVKLTRLPTYLLNRFIKNSNGNKVCSVEISAADFTELDIKFEPDEELKEEPQDYDDAIDDNATDLGLHTELDIKSEPEEELKEEPQDYDDAVDDNGAPPTDVLKLKTNGTSEDIDLSKPFKDANTGASNYFPRNDKKTNTKYLTKEVSGSETDVSQKRPYGYLCAKFNNSKANIDQCINNDSGIQSAKEYLCATCKYTTSRAHLLKSHLQAHSAARHYICDTCSCITKVKRKLIDHIRTHTGERPYVCKICDKKFSHSSNLYKHMRIHTGERPFVCKICDKKFSQNSNLHEHMGIHTGERPYVCKICDIFFTRKSSLHKHKRIHTGKKLYACNVCVKKFTLSSGLKVHMRTHTGERPYVCNICDKKFTQTSSLHKHMRIHTGKKSPVLIIFAINSLDC